MSNNHAVLVYGYDPERGYLISDPYNYYNRGEVYQYWRMPRPSSGFGTSGRPAW